MQTQMILFLCIALFAILWLHLKYTRKMENKIQNLLQNSLQKPLLDITERMTRNSTETREVLMDRLARHSERVQQHLHAAELRLQELGAVGRSISDLNSLLKLPHLRGGFGEATLERLLADFLPARSYELQYTIVPGSSERVDAVVKLHRQLLPIDSKFPREQCLPLFESPDTNDPAALERARRMLHDYVRGQARQIAEKYIRPDHGTTEMALLFLPSETLYFEVVRDTKLFETLARMKVFPVSPNTLAISLHSVAMAQEYYEMARGVERTIEDINGARRHFEHFQARFEDVGKSLRKAQEAFETAQTHLGRYGSSVQRLQKPSDSQAPLIDPPV